MGFINQAAQRLIHRTDTPVGGDILGLKKNLMNRVRESKSTDLGYTAGKGSAGIML